jgi:hypothetical protein
MRPGLPYGTPVRVSGDRISLTCVATCAHGNACALVAERGPDRAVSLYFHGVADHGAQLNPAQIHALRHWLADHDHPEIHARGAADSAPAPPQADRQHE